MSAYTAIIQNSLKVEATDRPIVIFSIQQNNPETRKEWSAAIATARWTDNGNWKKPENKSLYIVISFLWNTQKTQLYGGRT